ncbi:MAG: cytochrome c3 family protein [Fluviicola sp.]|jgi:hypothetical protein
MQRIQPSAFIYLLLLAIIGLTSTQCTNETVPEILPVDESYKPEKPIEFPHDIHTGKNKIDCKYCHNSAENGKNPGIPTEEICMKCHQQINGKMVSDSIKN